MKIPALDLEDICPREVEFTLGRGDAEHKFTLLPFTLRVRAWALQKFGQKRLQEILEKSDVVGIAELAHFMLKERPAGLTVEGFMDLIRTPKDQITLIRSLTYSIGISEQTQAELEQYAREQREAAGKAKLAQENPTEASDGTTGAPSST